MNKRKSANWFGRILIRNWLLKHIIDEKIEGRVGVTGRGRKRGKQLLDDSMEKTGYWNLQEEALDRILWRICCGRRLLACCKN